MKECTACKRALPNTAEFFHPYSGGKKGLRNQCRDCRNAQRNARYQPHPKPVRVSADGTQQTCTKCGETKPRTLEFWRKDFGSWCKVCHRAAVRECSARKRGPRKPRVIDLPAGTKEYQAAYYALTRETQIRKVVERQRANRERTRQKGREWRERHLEKDRERCRIKSQNRRAIKKATEVVKITDADIAQKLEAQKHRCFYCGCRIKGREYHIEHVIPLSRGGTHTLGNLVIACESCNLQKGAKDLWEFMANRAS